MDTVKQAALGICVAAVLTGALYLICPDGVMNRKMKYVTGLMMLFCIVSPFLRLRPNPPSALPDSTVTYNAEKMLSAQSEYVISEALRAAEITFTGVEVITDISDSGDISIISVRVTGVRDTTRAYEVINSSVRVGEVVFSDG